MSELTSLFLDRLIHDQAVADRLGTNPDLAAMLAFETALAESEALHGLIPEDAAAAIVDAGSRFVADIDSLTTATLNDGVVVPELIRQLKTFVHDDKLKAHVHFGATSQDVIDTALAIKLATVIDLFEARIGLLIEALDLLIAEHGENALMGRTRMQGAIPITAGDRLRVWRGPLVRALEALPQLRREVLVLSLAGAAGTAEKFGDKIGALRETLAGKLNLFVPNYVPHAQRDRIAGLGNWLSLLTGALGKIGQDVALMAQNEIREITLSGGGASSAMAHKQNPVSAEVLVALARYNATLLSGLHQAVVHEQERSGAAWTLEWLVLPQMLNTTGASLLHAAGVVGSIKSIGRA